MAQDILFRELLDRLPVAVARLDSQLRILYLNRRLSDSLGVAAADALGRNCLELGMSPANWGLWVPVALGAFETGQPAEFEYLSECGAIEHFVQYRFAPELGPDGKVESLLVAAFFNDEVHRLRTALAASELRFQSFMDAMPVLAWLRDDADRYVYLNPKYCGVMQIAPKEWHGKHPRDVWPAEVAEQFIANDRLAAETGEPIEVRESGRTPDGSLHHWQNVKFSYVDPTGQRFFGGVGLDITRQIELEEESRKLEKRLFQAQKLESLGLMAGGVAHDFNNLLTAILGNLSLARMHAPSSGPLVDCLAKVEQASMRAAELCQQMLAYSGRGYLTPKEVDLNAIVREWTQLVGPLLSERTEVKMELAAGPLLARGDASQLRQVAMNLITNASESIGDRPGSIRIRSGTRRLAADDLRHLHTTDELPPGDYVYLEVADTGCGMTDATMARIFEPFFSTKFTGRGLGLAAVQGILRGHQGTITVASSLGTGSIFTVLLPALDPAKPAKPTSRERVLARSGLGKLVLVIDDEADVRGIMKRVLEATGFSVLDAADGLEGAAMYREHKNRVNLILLDLTMPKQSGAVTFRELRLINSAAKVILTSGFGPNQALAEFEGQGLCGFLRKPFKVEELLDAVFAALKPPGS